MPKLDKNGKPITDDDGDEGAVSDEIKEYVATDSFTTLAIISLPGPRLK